MSDRKTLRLHKWLDDPYRESLPTWVVESIRSVLAENRGHHANNTALAARCDHLERRAVKAEEENERLRADFADFREMHYDTKGEIERLRARIEAALAQLKRNLCDCREDDCHHCELVRLTVEALKGDK